MKLKGLLLALEIVRGFMNNLSEDQKRAIDAQLDKLENKFEPNSWEDIGMEFAVGIIRGRAGIPDYSDVETEDVQPTPPPPEPEPEPEEPEPVDIPVEDSHETDEDTGSADSPTEILVTDPPTDPQ